MTRVLLLAALLGAATGCASTAERDPRDPWEPLNRGIYSFNDKLDAYVARPVEIGRAHV